MLTEQAVSETFLPLTTLRGGKRLLKPLSVRLFCHTPTLRGGKRSLRGVLASVFCHAVSLHAADAADTADAAGTAYGRQGTAYGRLAAMMPWAPYTQGYDDYCIY
ncbi:hypothetical protein BHAP_1728 [Bifidobacterium hapali]|uniref:Uncharacterized protein n=1 Tax=Bifidobacterium hapali TaxID=1630172 RepID=A0A261FXP1_9BIFI|nr:hypothetical protein BHAP_1728 [Bifidobacterium hapali]